ncbi:MAG: hypothetical protein IPI83_15680 [Sphingomonadales bacterium]|nr:hypothetical protein [Sphingomonadales bacterium]
MTAQERAQGVASRLDIGAGATPLATSVAPAAPLSSEQQLAAAKAEADAEAALKAGENDRAIQILTMALTFPENEHSARARELLGLTRERKGQAAHARAEYEEYLRRYPAGEASDRVRQRLAALLSLTRNRRRNCAPRAGAAVRPQAPAPGAGVPGAAFRNSISGTRVHRNFSMRRASIRRRKSIIQSTSTSC